MSEIEWIAAAFGLANIILLVRRNIWNYPAALVMVSLYAWIFWGQKLYSDMILQGMFFALNIYGWLHWRRAQTDQKLPVRTMQQTTYAYILILTILGWTIWSFAMDRLTDAQAPYWDGAVAALSVTGQILLARRFIANWYYWIAVDIIAIPLFYSRELYATAALYTVFLILCIFGLIEWRRAYAAQPKTETIFT
jgi:nicotinamide mononucleotide transporter